MSNNASKKVITLEHITGIAPMVRGVLEATEPMIELIEEIHEEIHLPSCAEIKKAEIKKMAKEYLVDLQRKISIIDTMKETLNKEVDNETMITIRLDLAKEECSKRILRLEAVLAVLKDKNCEKSIHFPDTINKTVLNEFPFWCFILKDDLVKRYRSAFEMIQTLFPTGKNFGENCLGFPYAKETRRYTVHEAVVAGDEYFFYGFVTRSDLEKMVKVFPEMEVSTPKSIKGQ